MRVLTRSLSGLAVGAVLLWGAACSSTDSTGPSSVSLAGSYTLTSFSEAGNDLTQAVQTGTLVLTGTTYSVNIQFLGNVAPAVVDSGTYTATATGAFSQTSTATGQQATGTYTNSNGVLSVNVTSQGVAVAQTWQKQ
jgi:hypothetical protein